MATLTIGLKAFWLMHVDAQWASGSPVTEYANARRLNVRRLRREVREFLRNTEAPNWRELMHPANRPRGQYQPPIRENVWTRPMSQGTRSNVM
jgi:hypothetical protein